MTTAVRQAPHHNTLTCYTDYRCRRPDCVERYNERNRARLQAHKDGTWNRYVDAEPVRKHLLALADEDVTPYIVAATVGASKQTVHGILHPNKSKNRGRQQRINPTLAAKILAVTPDNCRRGKISSTGTVRRLQALVAAGWPLKEIAAHAGVNHSNMSRLLRNDFILASTAKTIADTYNALAHQSPERHGVDKTQAKRARNWAASQGWAKVTYWADRMDVIDDPDFQPLYGVTKREIVAQDANWLMTEGRLDRASAAARLGVSKAYIDHAFRDHPQYAVEAAA